MTKLSLRISLNISKTKITPKNHTTHIMDFILNSSFYSLLGLLLGFFTHLFYGIVQSSITFDRHYVTQLFKSSLLLTLVFGMVNVIMIPFASSLSTSEFSKDLVYYLMAFAAFDFTDNVVKYDSDFLPK